MGIVNNIQLDWVLSVVASMDCISKTWNQSGYKHPG